MDKCPTCGGSGRIELTDCPLRQIPAEVFELVELARLYTEHGLPPIAGGTLDQAHVFLQAAAFVASEDLRHEADRAEARAKRRGGA